MDLLDKLIFLGTGAKKLAEGTHLHNTHFVRLGVSQPVIKAIFGKGGFNIWRATMNKSDSILTGREVVLGPRQDQWGLWGFFTLFHHPFLLMARGLPEEAGKAGFVLEVKKGHETAHVPLNEITFRQLHEPADIIMGVSRHPGFALLASGEDAGGQDGEPLRRLHILRKDAYASGNLCVLDKSGTPLNRAVVSRLLWGFHSGFGMNLLRTGRPGDAKRNNARMTLGYDDMGVARGRMATVVGSLRRHGLDLETFFDQSVLAQIGGMRRVAGELWPFGSYANIDRGNRYPQDRLTEEKFEALRGDFYQPDPGKSQKLFPTLNTMIGYFEDGGILRLPGHRSALAQIIEPQPACFDADMLAGELQAYIDRRYFQIHGKRIMREQAEAITKRTKNIADEWKPLRHGQASMLEPILAFNAALFHAHYQGYRGQPQVERAFRAALPPAMQALPSVDIFKDSEFKQAARIVALTCPPLPDRPQDNPTQCYNNILILVGQYVLQEKPLRLNLPKYYVNLLVKAGQQKAKHRARPQKRMPASLKNFHQRARESAEWLIKNQQAITDFMKQWPALGAAVQEAFDSGMVDWLQKINGIKPVDLRSTEMPRTLRL